MIKKTILIILITTLSGILMAESKTNQKINDLEKKLQTVSGEKKIEILNELSVEMRQISVEKSIQFSTQALDLAKKHKDITGQAKALRNSGVGYRLSGKVEKGLGHLNQALSIFKALKDKKNTSNVLKEIGVVFWRKGNYDTALKYYFEALEIAKEIGYQKGIGNCIHNIGIIYLWHGYLDKALKNYQQGLEIDKKLKNKSGMAISYSNIAIVYNKKKNGKKALEYYLKSAKLAEELGDSRSLAVTYSNMGILYKDLKDMDRCIEYFIKSFTYGEKIGAKHLAAISINNLAAAYVNKQEWDKALNYAQKSSTYAKEVGDKFLIRNNLINFSHIYVGKKEYKKALEYYKEASKIDKEIFSENSSKQIAEMETKYKTLEKEKKIALLEKNEEIQKIILNKERFTRNALIVGLVLILTILILLFKKYLYLFAFWKKEKYIGQFRLTEQIGAGGMGTIFKAHNIRDKTDTVALKVLKEELFQDDTNIKRFKQEATIIDKLDHPNIIKIIERGEYKGKYFIAMEYLKGITLDIKIARQSLLDLKDCYSIMFQISDALCLIHSKNIIHRDIKPSNIMLIERDTNPNFVKLMDFGLATTEYQTRLTQTGIMVGTVNYMSPEQLGQNEYSLASDVYSLGVTFYEITTAKKPFHGETPTDIMKEILDKTPIEPGRFRSDLPQKLNELIMSMLKKDKNSRPKIQDIFETLKKFQSR